MNSVYSFASSGSGTVKVVKGSVMTQAKTGITRTGNYNYARVKATSIYPTGNYTTDNYTKCKVRLYHNTKNSTPISSTYTITEGSWNDITINNGYLAQKKFDLCFAGNDPALDAYVVYAYNGK